MKTEIFESYYEFSKREDKKVNGVSKEFAYKNPEFEKENDKNDGCWDCSGCSRCHDLENASPVSRTEENADAGFKVPIIGNIHSKIFQVVSQPNALNMADWHTCDTTHCRAGWVVQLAGEEGKLLEKKTSAVFAAIQIYHKSNPDIPVSPTQFYKSNIEAMEDMRRCAEAESNQ